MGGGTLYGSPDVHCYCATMMLSYPITIPIILHMVEVNLERNHNRASKIVEFINRIIDLI